MSEEIKIKVVTEAELAACEAAIAERLGPDAPKPVEGCAGNSPYSAQTIVFRGTGANERGARVAVVAVCRSHDGAGAYKGRGRWRTVYIMACQPGGPSAVCDSTDRDAEEIGRSGVYIRPWATHRSEIDSRGLGLAQDAMASAFETLGL